MTPSRFATLGLLALLACATLAPNASAESRPNFVLILADDMGAEDCGAMGHPHIRTPNLDTLARQGMVFEQALLTCSSCSPSRASLITGRYPHSTDAEQLHWPLPEEQVPNSFVQRLREAGYYTAASGKWHLGPHARDAFHRIDEVSDASFQLRTDDQGQPLVMADANNASGCAGWLNTLESCPPDQPFFLWLAAVDPHRDYAPGIVPQPHTRDEVVVPPYLPDTPEVREDLALYYDEIARLDSYVGLVLDALEQRGVAEETYVIFMSDNGRPFPRCKTTVLDSGIRTPLMIRRPGHVPSDARTQALVSSLDIAPTIMELAGLEPPDTVQGASFAHVLDDPTAEHHSHVFAEHNWHDYDAHQRAVRGKRFKYIRNFDSHLTLSPPADAVRSPTFQTMRRLNAEGALESHQQQCFVAPRPAEELYDLEADPHELVNLAGQSTHQATLEEYRALLDAWRVETHDAGRTFRSADEFDRGTGDPLPNRTRPRVGKFDGFVPMFDGASLEGWTPVTTPASTWTFKEGVLHCTGKPIGELRTTRMYQNFVLELEWRHMVPRGNAGVFVWADAITARGVPFHRGIEVQILENEYGNTQSYTTHGDIFPIHGASMTPINGRGGGRAFPTENRSNPSPEWNHYRIVCNDGEISLAVNGRIVTQGRESVPKKGYICLESEGGVVEYRNIRIKEFPDTPVEAHEIAQADEGFRCLYRGIDLDGWATSSPDAWKAQDWVLAFQPPADSQSNSVADQYALRTQESFGDCDVIVDVRRKTEASACAIQLRGVTVDLASAPLRDHLSDPGTWDRVEVTLRDDAMSVAINGRVVIDAQPQRELEQTGPLSIQPQEALDLANIYVRP